MYNGPERRHEIIHLCKLEDLVREMHGDIKSLVAQQTFMNGKLVDTKVRFEKHDKESNDFRGQVVKNTIWRRVYLGAITFIFSVLSLIVFGRK